MKENLETNYVLPCLVLVSWTIDTNTLNLINQARYFEKFDEFLIRCSTLHREGEAQILFRFRVNLRDDLRTELLVRGVNMLETAYTLVQDLDSARTLALSRVTIIGSQCLDHPHIPNPIGLVRKPFI